MLSIRSLIKMSSAYRWGDKKTIKFVKLYRDHENLWDMFCPEYRDRDARNVSFQAIADEINIPNFTVKDVPKKIKSLRSTYYLEVSKIGKSKASGGGTDYVYKPSLPWFNDMAYIIKTATIKEKETHNNLELVTQETLMNSNTEKVSDDDLNNLSEPILPIEQSVRSPTGDKTRLPARLRNKGQKRKIEAITDAVRELKSLNEILVMSNTASQEDECEIMGKYITIQLRELPVLDRLQANFEIQKILLDFRLKNINTVTSLSAVSSDTSHSPASTILDRPSTPYTSPSEES